MTFVLAIYLVNSRRMVKGCQGVLALQERDHHYLQRKEVNEMKKVKIQIRKLEKIETTGARHAQNAG